MSTISKKRLDGLIPDAIQVIKDVKIAIKRNADENDNSFHASRTYSGYFSSFGADMVNTSPLATAIFCEDKSKEGGSSSKEDRSNVALAVLKLMKKEKPDNFTGVRNKNKLSDFLLTYHGNIPISIVYDMLAAAIALKIALRTFKKKD